jgi:hypothetical protein
LYVAYWPCSISLYLSISPSLVAIYAAQLVVEVAIPVMDAWDVDVALREHRATLAVCVFVEAAAATTDPEARHSVVGEAAPVRTAAVAIARVNRHWKLVL